MLEFIVAAKKLLLFLIILFLSAFSVYAFQIVTGPAIPGALQSVSSGLSLPLPTGGVVVGSTVVIPIVASVNPVPLGGINFVNNSRTLYPCLKRYSGGVPGILIYQTTTPDGEIIITEFMRQQTPYDCTETALAVALKALNLADNLSLSEIHDTLFLFNSYPASDEQLRRLLRAVVAITNGTANITHYGANPVGVNGVDEAPFPPPRPLPPLTLRVVLFSYVGVAGQGHSLTITKIHNDTQLQNITVGGGSGGGPGGGRTPRPFIVNTISYFDPADSKMHIGKIARADFPTPSEGPNDEGDEYIQLADGIWGKVGDAVDIRKNN